MINLGVPTLPFICHVPLPTPHCKSVKLHEETCI